MSLLLQHTGGSAIAIWFVLLFILYEDNMSEVLVKRAKLAEQAERYEDMAKVKWVCMIVHVIVITVLLHDNRGYHLPGIHN